MEFKIGQRVRVTEADPEVHDSDVGQTGVVVASVIDCCWVHMDTPTRYPNVPEATMPDGRTLTEEQDSGYCDCIANERLELIPFEPFSRVRVDAPSSPYHGLRGVTLDYDDMPWVRFNERCNDTTPVPGHLYMPDGRPITKERDGGHCDVIVVDDLVLDETEDKEEATVLPPGTRVRRTDDGRDSFAGMTGTVHSSACSETARWVRFDQPTLYRSVPPSADEVDVWRFDLVPVFALEPIETK